MGEPIQPSNALLNFDTLPAIPEQGNSMEISIFGISDDSFLNFAPPPFASLDPPYLCNWGVCTSPIQDQESLPTEFLNPHQTSGWGSSIMVRTPLLVQPESPSDVLQADPTHAILSPSLYQFDETKLEPRGFDFNHELSPDYPFVNVQKPRLATFATFATFTTSRFARSPTAPRRRQVRRSGAIAHQAAPLPPKSHVASGRASEHPVPSILGDSKVHGPLEALKSHGALQEGFKFWLSGDNQQTRFPPCCGYTQTYHPVPRHITCATILNTATAASCEHQCLDLHYIHLSSFCFLYRSLLENILRTYTTWTKCQENWMWQWRWRSSSGDVFISGLMARLSGNIGSSNTTWLLSASHRLEHSYPFLTCIHWYGKSPSNNHILTTPSWDCPTSPSTWRPALDQVPNQPDALAYQFDQRLLAQHDGALPLTFHSSTWASASTKRIANIRCPSVPVGQGKGFKMPDTEFDLPGGPIQVVGRLRTTIFTRAYESSLAFLNALKRYTSYRTTKNKAFSRLAFSGTI